MTEVRENYKGDRKMPPFCPLCNQERDTTEHVVECKFLNERNPTTELQVRNLSDTSIKKLELIRNHFAMEFEERENRKESTELPPFSIQIPFSTSCLPVLHRPTMLCSFLDQSLIEIVYFFYFIYNIRGHSHIDFSHA